MPLADEAAREAEAERERLDPRSDADRAELRREALLELAQEILRRRGASSALASAWLSFQTMLDWRPGIGRMANGPAGRKCCSAPPFVIALVRDRRDDAGLAGVPTHGGNFGERAQFGARAVGRDDEPRDATRRRRRGRSARRAGPARSRRPPARSSRRRARRRLLASALATSSLNAICASGSPSRASNFKCSIRTASLTPPS